MEILFRPIKSYGCNVDRLPPAGTALNHLSERKRQSNVYEMEI
jgi:hypothetical protein